MSIVRLILFLLLLAALISCGGGAGPPTVRLTAVAPDYLEGFLDSTAGQFARENGVRIIFRFEPPDSILPLVRNDPDFDLFIAANPERWLESRGDTLIRWETLTSLFEIPFVMVGRVGGPVISAPDDLIGDRIRRVCIVDPEAGMEGRLGHYVLQKQRIWEKIQNRLILARSSEHVLSYLTTGEVDAALVFEYSLGQTPGVTVMDTIDLGNRLVYCGAVMAGSENPDPARAFLDLFTSRLCALYQVRGFHLYRDR